MRNLTIQILNISTVHTEGYFGNDFIGYKNINVLKQILDKYALRRTKDILELPPKTIINEYVEMSPRQQIFYNNIQQGIFRRSR